MTIAARISNLLHEHKMMQKDLAHAAGIAPSTLNSWIKNDAEAIPSHCIMPICRAFGILPEELLEGIEPIHRGQPTSQPNNVPSQNEKEPSILELKLLDVFRSLDEESQIIVLSAAVQEKRRSEKSTGDGCTFAC